MKAFSVVFRDNATGTLYGGIVDQQELTRMVNNSAITICVTRQIWGHKLPLQWRVLGLPRTRISIISYPADFVKRKIRQKTNKF